MLNGNRDTALNVKIQLSVTIPAFKASIPCSRNESAGIFPIKNTGERSTAQVKLTKNKTGKTAFPVKAFFLDIS